MKKLYLFAALAAMLAACSENDLSKDTADLQQNAEKGSVMFDAYTQRGVTRAGQTGVMTNEKLKAAVNLTDQNGGGFGVFGYYTDNNDYEQSRMPDFMYNQLVEWTGAYWKYEPIKYWPNEYGSNAISDDADKVTFFAYAPYVATNASGKIERTTGDELTSYGITGLSRNSNQGDPIVKYIASFERAKSVDLLWGVVGAAEVTGWGLINGGTQDNLEKGYPWLNVMRPAEAATQADAAQRVKFTFAHALTQLTMNIDAIVDEINKGNNTLAANTKIYVRQLSMTGVALKGALNLNNTEAGESKALWLDYNGLADIESGVPVVLYDGRKDGKEGVAGATASNEKVLGFNPDIISNDGNTSEGVTATAKKVFADDPVMLIPTGENMELEIIYDVETTDPMLPTLLSDGKYTGSSVENKVRKTIDFPQNGIANGLENGKHYTINLHLGMNSVKFDVANVEGWSEVLNQPEVDLPSNGSSSVPGVANAASAALSIFPVFTGITYNPAPYQFKITGLEAGETIKTEVVSTSLIDALYDGTNQVTVTVNSAQDGSGTANEADANGTTWVTVALQENNFVHNLSATNNYILVEGQTSLKGWKARFEQEAHPFGLQVNSLDNVGDNDEIVLEAASTNVDDNALNGGENSATELKYGYMNTDPSDVANFVKLSVNGSSKLYGIDYTYSYDGSNNVGKITYIGHLVAGDKVSITVAARNIAKNAEDGAKETVEFTTAGIIGFTPANNQTLTYSATGQDPLVPILVGDAASPAPTYAYSKNGTATFYGWDGTNKKITTSDNGTEANAIKCVATFTAASGYFLTTSSCTATYDLTVTEQATTLTWNTPTEVMTNIGITDGTSIGYSALVTVKDANTNTITTTSGDLTYAVTSVKVDGSDAPANTIVIDNENTGTIKVGSAGLIKAKNYEVTITATFDKEATTGYKKSSATKVITVQSVGE